MIIPGTEYSLTNSSSVTPTPAPDEFVSEYSIPRIITPVPGIIRISQPGITWELSVSRLDDHAQHYEFSVMAETKKMVHVLLDFKANWREFYDHSYVRHFASNQRRLGK